MRRLWAAVLRVCCVRASSALQGGGSAAPPCRGSAGLSAGSPRRPSAAAGFSHYVMECIKEKESFQWRLGKYRECRMWWGEGGRGGVLKEGFHRAKTK